MSLRNSGVSWGTGAKVFHWVMAFGIIGTSLFVLHVNDSMPWFKSSAPVFIVYVHWHKAFGLILLLLALLRLLWKWLNPKPETVELSPVEAKLSRWTHSSLYALMFIVPLSGWIASSAFGSPTKFFGLFNVPGIIEKSKPLVGPAYWAHFSVSWLLLSIISFHVFAAFWHHDRKKDDVLRAMWFGRRQKNRD